MLGKCAILLIDLMDALKQGQTALRRVGQGWSVGVGHGKAPRQAFHAASAVLAGCAA